MNSLATMMVATMLLAGCGSSGPTAEVEEVVPLYSDRVEAARSDCGGSAFDRGIEDFSPTLQIVAVDGMDLVVMGKVSGPGEHRLRVPNGRVTDEEGIVAGFVAATSRTDQPSIVRDEVVEAGWTVRLQACDGGSGEPLADGSYRLELFGRVDPVDHLHARPEGWVGPVLPFQVVDGEIDVPPE